ncbi:MAG: S-layer homology domain-containing protein [Acidimicrobiaceae bacterium]|nr:S-layer homology domain-containing protein [Acidimicrobiaceae bacterium]
MLAAGALVASLFAVGAAPAAALDEDSKPNAPAATSACVGDATDDWMFSDVSEMNTFRAEINCLAYYGVTVGYGDGNFGPEDDVTRGQMVLFMERAADKAGADAEAVVGDFAETGSDPVNRGDMGLLIARLLVAATTAESSVNVTNNADGTFAVSGVGADDWDYFADSRRLQNRVKDSAASALYELGVAKGSMGDFMPASSVSRGEMAAFITRALDHTSARPAGVSIQSHTAGEVTVSVRDANFHPVPNAQIDIVSITSARIDEAFNEDGTCNTPRFNTEPANATRCEIDANDPVTGLSGDFSTSVPVAEGGTTVFAWEGETGDKHEDGGEGLASVELTEIAPNPAANAKVTTDMAMGANRAVFGSTVTVTIQLVDADGGDAGPPEDGASYQVVVRTLADDPLNAASDDLNTAATAVTEGSSVTTNTYNVDASGKATFTVTAPDPDPNDDDDPDTGSVDRVRVTYTVTQLSGPLETGTQNQAAITDPSATITFSDAPSVPRIAAVTASADYLMAPPSGSANNVVTVTIADQYGKPMRNQMVRLSSTYEPTGDRTSGFPVARRTDSSGSVRIGYTYTGAASVETVIAHVADDDATLGTDNRVPANTTTAGQADIYWVGRAAGPDVASGAVLVADIEQKTLIVADTTNGPQLVRYDDNDQFEVGGALVTQATFEQTLGADSSNNDTLIVSSYDPDDASDVARFSLTVVDNT